MSEESEKNYRDSMEALERECRSWVVDPIRAHVATLQEENAELRKERDEAQNLFRVATLGLDVDPLLEIINLEQRLEKTVKERDEANFHKEHGWRMHKLACDNRDALRSRIESSPKVWLQRNSITGGIYCRDDDMASDDDKKACHQCYVIPVEQLPEKEEHVHPALEHHDLHLTSGD